MLSEVVGPVSTHLVAEEDALLAHTATARTDPFTCTPRTPRQHGAGAASMRLFRPSTALDSMRAFQLLGALLACVGAPQLVHARYALRSSRRREKSSLRELPGWTTEHHTVV
jgi:hypothetical protein